MTTAQMIVLSLGLSVVVAAVGGLAALLLQKFNPDPRLRERVWSHAFWAPALAPLATALLLLGPAPAIEIAPSPGAATMSDTVSVAAVAAVPAAEPVFIVDWSLIALVVLGVAAALSATRLIALAVRTARLHRFVHSAQVSPLSLVEAVRSVADTMWVRAPAVRVSSRTSEALLAGLFRPVLILPTALAGKEETPDARAIVAHELAHLKRRDHHALWLEEALLVVLAINPLLPLVRRARAAAREEACDALALTGAATEVRRAYAQSLIEALKQCAEASATGASDAGFAPALTFTGSRRSYAMSRLKAVLDPAPAASRRARLTVLSVAAMILGLAGAGSFAVAGQRAPELISSDESASLPITTRDAVWLNAALDPIYKAAWPKACGFGSNSDGKVFIHVGKGCTTDDVTDPILETVAFIDISRSPRDAFEAVKSACDAGRDVAIRFRQGGVRAETSVACAQTVVSPAPAKALEVMLTWRGVTLEPGDRLMISLEKTAGDNTWRRSLDFALEGRTDLPSSVKAMVQPEYFQDQRSPSMKTALIGRDGRVRAVSSNRVMPMLIREAQAIGYAVMSPVSPAQTAATDATIAIAHAASASLTPEQRVRYANPTGVNYQAFCKSEEDEPFCSGVLFGMLPSADAGADTRGICPPRDASGDWDIHAVSEQGKRAVAKLSVRSDQSAADVARTALRTAFPCQTETRPIATSLTGAPVPSSSGALPMQVTLERGGKRVSVAPGEKLIVQLTTDYGTLVSGFSNTVTDQASLNPAVVNMPIDGRYVPRIGQSTRVFTLTGVLYGENGSVISRAETVTIRLAPGSRPAANLRPTLIFPT